MKHEMKLVMSLVILLIILVPPVFSLGSIQTASITPSAVSLCGSNQQYVTIIPGQIYNKENTSLLSVSAKLVVSGNPGISFVTNQNVNLGNVLPLSLSAITPSWTLQCLTPLAGIYTVYINYSTANNYFGSSIDEAVSILTVYDTLFFTANVSLIADNAGSQVAAFLIADSSPTIKVATSRNAMCKGTVDLDEPYDNMDFMFYGALLEHNYTFVIPIPEGQHDLYVKCKDELNNIMPVSQIISFKIDTKEPVLTVISPGLTVVGDYAELKVSSNEDAECRFDKNDDAFNSMRHFSTISGNIFTEQITDLEEESYRYYLSCKDKVGNVARKEINFEVQIPPKARIVWEKDPPLSKDTYKLTLIPSKPLRGMPLLFYKFTDDDSFKRDVTLVKDGSVYQGYIIIDDQDKTRSGVLTFRGFDLQGNEGTEITEGSAFLVDTVRPIAPADVAVIATEEGIRLSWYYEGEKPDHFNLYRSQTAGVGPIHFYDSVKATEFLDDNVLSNQLYYYRVAAVDVAGNQGIFSKEVSVYAKSGNSQEVDLPAINSNPPTQDTRDWKARTEKDIETLLIDLGWAENNLKEMSGKESAIGELSLIKKVSDAQLEVDKLKAQLKGLDVVRITDADLRESLSKGDALIARTRKMTPQSLEVVKSTDITQATSPSDIELAVKELLAFRKSNYSDGQVKSYIKQMEKVNSNVKIETGIKTIMIKFIDGTGDSQVMVNKKFYYDMPDKLFNVFAVEVIPKTVAGDIGEIEIRTPDYLVINEDPVFALGYDSISYDKSQISYGILSNDNSESAKGTKLIVLVDPDILLQKQSDMITGFSILLSKASGLPLLGIVLGILIIVGLGSYYFIVVNDVNIGNFIKIPKLNFERKIINRVNRAPEKIGQSEITDPATLITLEQAGAIKSKYSQILKDESPLGVAPSKYFRLRNTDVIRSLSEISDVLRKIDDFTYRYHVHDFTNDFADWIDKIYEAHELAAIVRETRSKEEMIKLFDSIVK